MAKQVKKESRTIIAKCPWCGVGINPFHALRAALASYQEGCSTCGNYSADIRVWIECPACEKKIFDKTMDASY